LRRAGWRSSRGCCLGGPVRSAACGRSRTRSSIVRRPRRVPGRDGRRALAARVVPSVRRGRGAPRAARERDGRRARSAGRRWPGRRRADRGCHGRSRSPRGASRERSGRPGFARARRSPTAASDGARAGPAAARAPRQHRDLRGRAARPAPRRARSEGSVVLSSPASAAGILGSARSRVSRRTSSRPARRRPMPPARARNGRCGSGAARGRPPARSRRTPRRGR